MRPLTARLEAFDRTIRGWYCSITVANHRLIIVIRFVAKSYTHPWKDFANKPRLVLHTFKKKFRELCVLPCYWNQGRCAAVRELTYMVSHPCLSRGWLGRDGCASQREHLVARTPCPCGLSAGQTGGSIVLLRLSDARLSCPCSSS